MDLRATARYSGGLAQDANALAGLKGQAKSDPQKALRSAAAQFEALFLQQLMKSMRAALPDDGPTDSDATKTYTEMLDAQLAQTLAKKGTGIADMLVNQLSRAVGATPAAGTDAPALPSSLPLTPSAKPLPLNPAATPRVLPKSAAAQPGSVVATATGVLSNAAAAVTGAAGDFVAAMRPYAEKAAQALGVPVHYLVAQAGLETGWGKHQPRAANGAPSHNLFGIKAGADWKGAVAEAETTEFVGGRAVRTVQRFRAYATPQEAFADFAQVLGNNRYAAALQAGTADGYAAHMQRAGYATDPEYASKLARTIKSVARRDAVSQALMAQERARAADTGTKSA